MHLSHAFSRDILIAYLYGKEERQSLHSGRR